MEKFRRIGTVLKFKMLNSWGLLGVLLISAIICITAFQPNSQIMGWDNFSVSLDLRLNFLRTFSAWREYRGLGVQSDSEVVDIFRQIILFLLQPIVGGTHVDQIYYFFCFILGAVGTYCLVKKVVGLTLVRLSHFEIEVASFLGSIVYIFNLYTVGTFYLPIVMYVVRYGAFPWLLYLFIEMLNQKKQRPSLLICFIISVLFTSVFNITATLFFTFLIILIPFCFVSLRNWKKIISLPILFIGLNSFWLFPFFNYTLTKSALIPMASTFVSVNEIQLNQLPGHFKWKELLDLVPSFFYTQYNHLPDFRQQPLHPFALTRVTSELWNLHNILFFSFIGTGIFFSFLQFRRGRYYGCIVFFISLLGTFFLRKEYPPFGFIYDWIGQHVPLLKIILRFGSEKFDPILAIGFSILFSIGFAGFLHAVTQRFSRQGRRLLFIGTALIITLVLILPLSFMFTELFSPLVRVSLPNEYHEIAKVINQDATYGRVLQLPMDSASYWKSYSWGYVGSSFFNYMINKPFVDRTFEPASLENDYLDQIIQRLLQNGALLTDKELELRAKLFQNLLEKTNTRYVLLDKSITPDIYLKSGRYFGKYSVEDATAVLNKVAEINGATVVYDKAVKVTPSIEPHLMVYRLSKTSPVVHSLTKVVNVDPQITNTFVEPLLDSNQNFIQSSQFPYRTYPFLKNEKNISVQNGSVSLTQDFVHDSSIFVSLNGDIKKELPIVEVFAAQQKNEIRITLKEMSPLGSNQQPGKILAETVFQVPVASGAAVTVEKSLPAKDFISNWSTQKDRQFSSFRLAIDSQIIPLSLNGTNELSYQGTVQLLSDTSRLVLLKENLPITISPLQFVATADTNCYKDKGPRYATQLNYQKGSVDLSSQDGTSCLTTSLFQSLTQKPVYAEWSLNAQFGEETKTSHTYTSPSEWQKTVAETIQQLPGYARASICLLEESGQCTNNHQTFGNTLRANQRFMPQRLLSGDGGQVLVTLPAEKTETQSLSLRELRVWPFRIIDQKTISVFANENLSREEIQTQPGQKLTLSFPFIENRGTYLMDEDSDRLQSFNGSCLNENGYQLLRQGMQNSVISYVENCQQGLYTVLPFDSHQLKLWTAEYSLLSGKDPQFSLQGKGTYTEEYLLRDQNIPDVAGFKKLQIADLPFENQAQKEKNIQDILEKTPFRTAQTTIIPDSIPGENENLVYAITQNTENQGVLALKQMNVVSLPATWKTLMIENGNSELNFAPAQIISTQKILPSLWRVRIKIPAAENFNVNSQIALEFGQAYDKQWEIHQTDSIFSVFLNRGVLKSKHVRSNGWANTWVVDTNQLPNETEVNLYFFFGPERLTIIGWFATSMTVVISVMWAVRKKVTHSKNETV